MSKPPRRFGRAVLAACSLLAITGVAFAGDKAAYHASNCLPPDYTSQWHVNAWGLTADALTTFFCPIDRDQTDAIRKPRVLVEAWHSSDQDSDLECAVAWLDEDSESGELRGWSENIEVSETGKVQVSFGAAEYDPMYAGLSPGGEGSIFLQCTMNRLDRLFHYYVEEDRF